MAIDGERKEKILGVKHKDKVKHKFQKRTQDGRDIQGMKYLYEVTDEDRKN